MELKMLTSLSRGQPGILHHITSSLVSFEYTRGAVRSPHTLLFVGGLGDGLGSVDFLGDIVRALDGTEWTIFSLILSSAYGGWGMGRLGSDIDEMAQCVKYIREYKEPHFGAGKVVIMGHSTGSQDVMHYINCANPRPAHPVFDHDYTPVTRMPVDGAIMQAPVSDREGILWVVKCGTARDSPAAMRELYNQAVENARKNTYEEALDVDTIVPLSVTGRIGYPTTAPVSSRRFLSLVSPDSPEKPDEDDLFSSDLSDAQLATTFGQVGARGLLNQKLLVLYSGRDQSVPPWVNKEALLKRWETAINAGGRDFWDPRSLVIPNASHALSDTDQAEPRRILVERVTAYLEDIRTA
ncbi:Esterase [Penicillium capsulatum]|uniref:Esterase n=1 Tax=Penicillium capsulatum TaxID=69766 RepID=A0A9W9INF3_9EURO|nr:Esterase [Penicillium capsulatum]KAJ6123286.1 Esterase [Penicillium capsulatum]